MPTGTRITSGGGIVASHLGRFLARFELQYPVVDPQNDSIENASVKSISGSVFLKDGTPAGIFDEPELVFEISDGRKFVFSYLNDGSWEIVMKRWMH